MKTVIAALILTLFSAVGSQAQSYRSLLRDDALSFQIVELATDHASASHLRFCFLNDYWVYSVGPLHGPWVYVSDASRSHLSNRVKASCEDVVRELNRVEKLNAADEKRKDEEYDRTHPVNRPSPVPSPRR